MWTIQSFCLLACLLSGSLAMTIDYLTTSCNEAPVYIATSRRLESSTALYYSNGMSCNYSVYVNTDKNVYLVVGNFDLEHEVNGACVDYVNIYDGADGSGALLAGPLCGTSGGTSYMSSLNTMMVQFVSDSAGNARGFDFNLVAATNGTCSGDQFSCTNGICIDSSLTCNNFDECGDNSDETNCASNSPPGTSMHDQAALIAGLTVGLTVAAIIAVAIALYCWRYNRWRVYMKRPLTAQEVVHSETTFTTSYPVTKVYYKEQYQDLYRAPEKPKYFGYQGEVVSTAT